MKGFSGNPAVNNFESGLPGEEEIDDGLGLLVRKKFLYHGSGISGIRLFNAAEEDTVGSGVYLTSEAKDATGYARRRSKQERYPQRADGKPVIADSVPILYETSIENLKVLDLRKSQNVKKILDGFKEVLHQKLINLDVNDSKSYWLQRLLHRAIDTIDAWKVGSGNLKEVAFNTGKWFSEYCVSLGYDGLVTLEGGEGEEVGNHDTYVIFDPKKVRVEKEQKVS